MQFFISSFSLLQELDILEKIIHTDEYNLLTLEINGDNLIILNSNSVDNLITIKIKIRVKQFSKDKVTVHTKFMINLLKTFTNENLLFKKKRNKLVIYSKYGNYDIPIYQYDKKNNYQIISKIENFREKKFLKATLLSKILLKILNKTIIYIGNEDVQSIENGLFFQLSPYGASFIATDTYKLIKYTFNSIKSNELMEFTIPKKSLIILKNILSYEENSVTFYQIIDIIQFFFQKKTFLCRSINENYPNYSSVFPKKSYDISFIINRIFFLNSIKRISIFSKKKIIFIRFCLKKNKIILYEEDTMVSSSSKIEYKYNNKNFIDDQSIKIGFNSLFLIDTLSSIQEEFVCFELYYSNKLGIFRPISSFKEEEILILIMSII
ncbi:DNA polymerase III subunit beta [Blattabacterium cuenoti]|uniref:DNA polymerase III subunit beta n=1 Tax=Blattabacterium cuenoti TaxID=1653831 RepID=UPI00163D1DEE|nr:DNA polymerase III subunit beta [Blattabacterium cuenoti]